MTTDDEPRTLVTVETTCDVINALQELEGATVTELANELEISKGGAYNHLVTLRKKQYVIKNDNDEYQLGLRFYNRGTYVIHNDILYIAGKSETDQLAEITGEYAHLMAEEFGRGVHIYKSKGENAISEGYNRKKMQYPDNLHISSTGKAVLAHLPKERVKRIIDRYGLPEMSDNTLTDRDELFAELETIRDRGYAINDQEEIWGTRAVGAPIMNQDVVYGAVSISGPVSRLRGTELHEEIAEKVVQTANVISVNIQTVRESE